MHAACPIGRVQQYQAASALGISQRAEASAIAAESDRRASIGARARFVGSASASPLLADRALWEAELADLRSSTAAVAAAAERTAEQRDAWLAASRRVKALELLDERRREEHRIEADREEAARVDDLVAGRFKHAEHEEAVVA